MEDRAYRATPGRPAPPPAWPALRSGAREVGRPKTAGILRSLSNDTDEGPVVGTPGPERRPRRRIVAVGVAVLLLVWGAAVVFQLFSAFVSAKDGLDSMADVREAATQDLPTFITSIGGSSDDLPEEQVAGQLQAASTDFGDARDRVDSLLVSPLKFVPVLGRQLRSVSALADSAATTAGDAGRAFDELAGEVADTAQTPEERLAAAKHTEQVLVELEAGLEDLDFGPTEGLLPPLARARNKFTSEYDRTMETLRTAVTSVTAVNSFLEGPTRYLVLAGNNSEMRAGSGMFLQVGTLQVDQGRFELSKLTPAGDLLLEQPGGTLDPDVQQLWDWLLPNREWRNLNVTPRFDESARMATEMWATAGRKDVDGVLMIDVLGLQRLLEIVGPVDVAQDDGTVRTVSADTVRQELLLDQYIEFGDDRDQRREQLGRVGTAVFESFNQRSFSASKLLQALEDAGAGRHVMLWSDNPVQQAGWEALGASGKLPADATLLSVLNRGGNKLDQFLQVTVDMSAVTTGETRRVTVKVTMANDTPPGLPTYVAGPYPGTTYSAGQYIGILALTVPGGAGNPAVSGGELYVSGQDGPTRVLSSKVDIQPGASAEVTFEYDLPVSWTEVEVLPSARYPEVTWTAGDQTWNDTEPQTVALDPLSG